MYHLIQTYVTSLDLDLKSDLSPYLELNNDNLDSQLKYLYSNF